MAKSIGLRPKTYSYLINDGSEDKKAKGLKMCHKKKTTLKPEIKQTI